MGFPRAAVSLCPKKTDRQTHFISPEKENVCFSVIMKRENTRASKAGRPSESREKAVSRLNRGLDRKNSALAKRNRKRKSGVIPTYDVYGRTITPELKRRRARIRGALLVIGGILCLIYVPGLFMQEQAVKGPVVTPDASAVRQCGSVLRNHTGDDFDHDGLTNADEEKYGTDPWNPDTDGDGAYDVYEVNTSHTDPTTVDADLLTDAQKKQDEKNGKDVGSPYKIGDVILWASDYVSKGHGSVVETTRGYRFSYFNGYAQFPSDKGKYVYRYANGVHTLLPYRSAENAWKISPYDDVELYDEPLEEIVELKLFSFPFYLKADSAASLLSVILPDKGFITAQEKTRIDVEPDTSDSVITDIKKPEFDKEDEYRFTVNSNTLNDLLFVRKSIADNNNCIAVSLYNKNYGEYLAIVYGYTARGDLLLADMDTLKPVGVLAITERATKVLNGDGALLSFDWFDFDGLGFHSSNGDKICFFAAASGSMNLNEGDYFGSTEESSNTESRAESVSTVSGDDTDAAAGTDTQSMQSQAASTASAAAAGNAADPGTAGTETEGTDPADGTVHAGAAGTAQADDAGAADAGTAGQAIDTAGNGTAAAMP